MDFTIDRSKWRCGDTGDNKVGEGQTALLNPEGFLCCLGQVAIQCGADEEGIHNVGEPRDCKVLRGIDNPLITVDDDYDPEDGFLIQGLRNTRLSEEAMSINDDTSIDLFIRECKLAALFHKHGHTITFIGEAVKP